MNSKYKAVFAAFIITLAATMCSCSQQKTVNSDFFAMNTYVSLVAYTSDDAVAESVKQVILSTEKQLSAHYEKSDINNLSNTDSETYKDTMILLSKAHEISQATDGAFDYTLGALTKLWDITGVAPTVPDDSSILDALEHTGYKKVSFVNSVYRCADDKLSIDLGAIAKGYAGDKALDCLKQNSVENACVSIGGNVSVIGSSENNIKKGISGWNVGIKNPFCDTEILGTVTVTDATVSVSGSYERYFEQNGRIYHHIMDPTSGYPADSDLASVAVICKEGYVADALSTALFVMGYDKAMDFYNSGNYSFEAIFCTVDGKVMITNGISNSFNSNSEASFAVGTVISFIH